MKDHKVLLHPERWKWRGTRNHSLIFWDPDAKRVCILPMLLGSRVIPPNIQIVPDCYSFQTQAGQGGAVLLVPATLEMSQTHQINNELNTRSMFCSQKALMGHNMVFFCSLQPFNGGALLRMYRVEYDLRQAGWTRAQQSDGQYRYTHQETGIVFVPGLFVSQLITAHECWVQEYQRANPKYGWVTQEGVLVLPDAYELERAVYHIQQYKKTRSPFSPQSREVLMSYFVTRAIDHWRQCDDPIVELVIQVLVVLSEIELSPARASNVLTALEQMLKVADQDDANREKSQEIAASIRKMSPMILQTGGKRNIYLIEYYINTLSMMVVQHVAVDIGPIVLPLLSAFTKCHLRWRTGPGEPYRQQTLGLCAVLADYGSRLLWCEQQAARKDYRLITMDSHMQHAVQCLTTCNGGVAGGILQALFPSQIADPDQIAAALELLLHFWNRQGQKKVLGDLLKSYLERLEHNNKSKWCSWLGCSLCGGSRSPRADEQVLAKKLLKFICDIPAHFGTFQCVLPDAVEGHQGATVCIQHQPLSLDSAQVIEEQVPSVDCQYTLTCSAKEWRILTTGSAHRWGLIARKWCGNQVSELVTIAQNLFSARTWRLAQNSEVYVRSVKCYLLIMARNKGMTCFDVNGIVASFLVAVESIRASKTLLSTYYYPFYAEWLHTSPHCQSDQESSGQCLQQSTARR